MDSTLTTWRVVLSVVAMQRQRRFGPGCRGDVSLPITIGTAGARLKICRAKCRG